MSHTDDRPVPEPLARKFQDVDRSRRADALTRYLDTADTVLGSHKQALVDALDVSQGDHVLDIGCGTGDDAQRLAERVGPEGTVTALDSSEDLLAEARRRHDDLLNVTFVAGDAQALAFDDERFDAALIDRVLMHVERPARVLAEARRVLVPGGRLAAMEPDWDLVAIDAEPLESTRAIVRAASDGHRHGTIGRSLARICEEAGFTLLRLEPRNWVFRDLQAVEALGELTTIADAALGTQAEAWLRAVRQRAETGRFLVVLTAFLIVAQRPAA